MGENDNKWTIDRYCEQYMHVYNERSYIIPGFGSQREIDRLDESLNDIQRVIANHIGEKARYENNKGTSISQIDSIAIEESLGLRLTNLIKRYSEMINTNSIKPGYYTESYIQKLCVEITALVMNAVGYTFNASLNKWNWKYDDEHV